VTDHYYASAIVVVMDVGEVLGTLRRQANMSQLELAEKSGVAQPVISLYEHGKRMPAADVFIALVEALGVKVAFEAPPGSPMAEDLVAEVLPDLLLLADALPQKPVGDLVFPRLPRSRR